MSVQIIPKFDRVLIKRETLQEKSSLIHIPESVDKTNRPERGIVIAVGPTAYISDSEGKKVEEIEVGVKVIFAKHAGAPIEIDETDDEYWIVSDTDILAEIREE